MKVILQKTIDQLGGVGDVVEVKDGFARNFLLPRNLAAAATSANLERVGKMKEKELQKEIDLRQKGEALARKISEMTCVVRANAGEDEKLFGSVTPAEIQRALHASGVEVERKDILMKHPIRKLGEASVDIRCAANVRATLKIIVERNP